MAQFRISDMLKGKGGKKEINKEVHHKQINTPTPSVPPSNQDKNSRAKPSRQEFHQYPEQNQGHFDLQKQEGNDLSLRDYWIIIIRYRGIVMSIIALFVIISIVLFFVLPKKYTANARLMSKSSTDSSSPFSMLDMGAMGGETEEYDMYTIIQIAKTDAIFKLVHEEVQSEFDLYIRGEEDISAKEMRIFNSITIDEVEGSLKLEIDKKAENIINIRSSLDFCPYLTAAIANSYSVVIIEEIKRLKHNESKSKLQTFENLIDDNQIELSSIDEKIRELSDSDPGKFSLTSRETMVFQKLNTSESNHKTALLSRREIEEQMNAIKTDFGIPNIPLEKVKWVDMSEGLQRRLQDLKYQREELLTRYKPENPSIKKLNNQIKSLQETLIPKDADKDLHYVKVSRFKITMVSNLLNLSAKLKAVEKRIIFIKQEIDSLNKDLVEVPKELKELRKLSASKQILITMQGTLHRQMQQEKILMLSMTAGLSVLESAKPALISNSAGIIKFVLGGLLIGIVLSVSLAFVLNNWENTIKNSGDLKRHFRFPPLGVIPQWSSDVKYIDESTPDSNIAEVYGMLRNNVRFCGIESPEKCLVVASAAQTEGKSLTAINLCLSFALEGNSTLLISSDLRRAYSHNQFKQKTDLKRKNGLVEYLEGKASLNEIIYKSTFTNFDFIPTCSRANNPTKLLKTESFTQMLNFAEANYDTVIIDTPAVLPVVDATIFASKAKGVLIIAHAGQTPISAIQEAINRLEHVNSPIIGIVLNRIKDLKLEYFYGYGVSDYAAYKTYS